MFRSGPLPLVVALTLMPVAACRGRPAPVVGEPEAIDHSEVHVLPRSANGRDYRITVGLPDSYAAHPDRRYPVLYVTDGYWDYKLLKSIIGGLVYDKVIPEVILVGLGYPGDATDYGRLRRWDLTPVHDSRQDDATLGASGHAGEFLEVIEQQIIPFVEGRYRADPSHRALGGSSLGGLFALYVMLTKPALFGAYIAPSPAVPYARGWLFGHEEAFAKSRQPLTARLYMTAAEKEEPFVVDAIKKLDAQLRAHAYPGLGYEFRVIEGERHAGTKPESFNRGVRFAFAPLALERNDDGPCARLATTLCKLGAAGSCADLEAALLKRGASEERCREAEDELRGIEMSPPQVRPSMAARVFADVTAGEKMGKILKETLMGLTFIENDVRERQPFDDNVARVRAIGPAACLGILHRYRDPHDRRLDPIFHQLLVDLRGQDLGRRPDAWQDWCDGVVKDVNR